MARKPTDIVQLKLRFPEALRRRLERAAKDNNQSMNGEIVRRLEASLRVEDAMRKAREAKMSPEQFRIEVAKEMEKQQKLLLRALAKFQEETGNPVHERTVDLPEFQEFYLKFAIESEGQSK